MNVSAIIVTRGDVDLSEIIDSLWDVADEILVWDNGARQRFYWWPKNTGAAYDPVYLAGDLAVYGRYAAIEYASGDLIYVADDDCVIENAQQIIDEWLRRSQTGPYYGIVANMPVARWPEFPDWCLVGWGAAFHRDLPRQAFQRFLFHGLDQDPAYLRDPFFNRECDTVFTTLTPHIKIDVGFCHLPWAEGPGRMFTDDPEGHRRERQRMLELARQVRDA